MPSKTCQLPPPPPDARASSCIVTRDVACDDEAVTILRDPLEFIITLVANPLVADTMDLDMDRIREWRSTITLIIFVLIWRSLPISHPGVHSPTTDGCFAERLATAAHDAQTISTIGPDEARDILRTLRVLGGSRDGSSPCRPVSAGDPSDRQERGASTLRLPQHTCLPHMHAFRNKHCCLEPFIMTHHHPRWLRRCGQTRRTKSASPHDGPTLKRRRLTHTRPATKQTSPIENDATTESDSDTPVHRRRLSQKKLGTTQAAVIEDDGTTESDSDTPDSDVDDVEEIQRHPGEEQILALTNNLVVTFTANHFCNKAYPIIFAQRSDIDNIADALDLEWAPGFLNYLVQDTPPPLSFFFSLPEPRTRLWGLYVVILQKKVKELRRRLNTIVYTGSGKARNRSGMKQRTNHYKDDWSFLPELLFKAIRTDGYTITHVRMLCWSAIPAPALQPRGEAFLLALEAAVSMTLHVIRPCKRDHETEHLLPWTRASVEWTHGCTHHSMIEGLMYDVSMSAEELEALAAARSERIKKRYKERYHTDPEYKKSVRAASKKWELKNAEKRSAKDVARREAMLDKKIYYCEPCDKPFGQQKDLDGHLKGKGHLHLINGVQKPTLTRKQARRRERDAEKRASGVRDYFCTPCDQSFNRKSHLDNHNNTPGHKANVVAVAAGLPVHKKYWKTQTHRKKTK
ncbi:unnamed protein product [Zymoseptoria tritici ST99CH_1E4]|uniref:C2H2-type domain-containing protein n=1 Tax=Zymoseptoria tritici ST99CH_1E4 TaxID=1276532 RepID=A0A2H1G4A6_ZYMTR|nr:unnamed protein product [Zymoseptoria tritici ST99CH_1E4]